MSKERAIGITTEDYLRVQKTIQELPCLKEYQRLYSEPGYYILRQKYPSWHMAFRNERNNAVATNESLQVYFTLLYSAFDCGVNSRADRDQLAKWQAQGKPK